MFHNVVSSVCVVLSVHCAVCYSQIHQPSQACEPCVMKEAQLLKAIMRFSRPSRAAGLGSKQRGKKKPKYHKDIHVQTVNESRDENN